MTGDAGGKDGLAGVGVGSGDDKAGHGGWP
jgi:hypothetical protein